MESGVMCVSFFAALPSGGYGQVLIYRQKHTSEGYILGMYSWWWLAFPLLHSTAFSLCTSFLWQIYRVRKIYNPLLTGKQSAAASITLSGCRWDPFPTLWGQMIPGLFFRQGENLECSQCAEKASGTAEGLVFWLIRSAVPLVKLTGWGSSLEGTKRGGEGGVLHPYVPNDLVMHKSASISSKRSS